MIHPSYIGVSILPWHGVSILDLPPPPPPTPPLPLSSQSTRQALSSPPNVQSSQQSSTVTPQSKVVSSPPARYSFASHSPSPVTTVASTPSSSSSSQSPSLVVPVVASTPRRGVALLSSIAMKSLGIRNGHWCYLMSSILTTSSISPVSYLVRVYEHISSATMTLSHHLDATENIYDMLMHVDDIQCLPWPTGRNCLYLHKQSSINTNTLSALSTSSTITVTLSYIHPPTLAAWPSSLQPAPSLAPTTIPSHFYLRYNGVVFQRHLHACIEMTGQSCHLTVIDVSPSSHCTDTNTYVVTSSTKFIIAPVSPINKSLPSFPLTSPYTLSMEAITAQALLLRNLSSTTPSLGSVVIIGDAHTGKSTLLCQIYESLMIWKLYISLSSLLASLVVLKEVDSESIDVENVVLSFIHPQLQSQLLSSRGDGCVLCIDDGDVGTLVNNNNNNNNDSSHINNEFNLLKLIINYISTLTSTIIIVVTTTSIPSLQLACPSHRSLWSSPLTSRITLSSITSYNHRHIILQSLHQSFPGDISTSNPCLSTAALATSGFSLGTLTHLMRHAHVLALRDILYSSTSNCMIPTMPFIWTESVAMSDAHVRPSLPVIRSLSNSHRRSGGDGENVDDDTNGITAQTLSPSFILCGGYHHLRQRCHRLLSWFLQYAHITSSQPLSSPPYISFAPTHPLSSSIAPPTGLLLYGPSGCGKSCIAHSLVALFQPTVSVWVISLSSILSPFLGESEEKIRNVFMKARRCAPCVMIIDDLDTIATDRQRIPNDSSDQSINDDDDSNGGVGRRVLGQLLCEMDGILTSTSSSSLQSSTDSLSPSTSSIFIIGICNRPDRVDASMLRPGRLDVHIYVPPPSIDDVVDILKTVGNRNCENENNSTKVLSTKKYNKNSVRLNPCLLEDSAWLHSIATTMCNLHFSSAGVVAACRRAAFLALQRWIQHHHHSASSIRTTRTADDGSMNAMIEKIDMETALTCESRKEWITDKTIQHICETFRNMDKNSKLIN